MAIFNHLSRIIETLKAIGAAHYALYSLRKLIPLKIVVCRLPDQPLAVMDILARYHKFSDDVDNPLDISNQSEVVMNPSAVPPKMHLQNANQSNQAGNTAKTRPSSKPDEDLKLGLRQRLHAKIDHWLDENMANLVEDALQATAQSRTQPVDKPEKTCHQTLMAKIF